MTSLQKFGIFNFEQDNSINISCYMIYLFTRKCPLCGHILAPLEGLRTPEVPGVNPRDRPQDSGDDSKAI